MKKNVFSRRQLAVPYAIFLFLFVIIPLFVLIYFGFTDENGRISFANFLHFFGSGKTIGTLLYSIVIALCTTIFCLILAYPVAFFLAKGNFGRKQDGAGADCVRSFYTPVRSG